MFTCARVGRGLAGGLFAIALVTAARSASADPLNPPERDDFFGKDKTAHFAVSAAVGGAGYAVTTAFARERWKAFAIGGGAAILVGALKEGVDGLGYGDPSWKDFSWDVMGAAAGLAIAFLVDIAVHGGKMPPLATRPFGEFRVATPQCPVGGTPMTGRTPFAIRF